MLLDEKILILPPIFLYIQFQEKNFNSILFTWSSKTDSKIHQKEMQFQIRHTHKL